VPTSPPIETEEHQDRTPDVSIRMDTFESSEIPGREDLSTSTRDSSPETPWREASLASTREFGIASPAIPWRREASPIYTRDSESSISSSNLNESQPDVIETREPQDQSHISIPVDTFEFSKPEDILHKLHNVRNEHIHTSSFNRAFIFTSWIILSLSLPATVAGYIGCFTLVSGSHGNGPLIWLLLEAGLSIIRILVWAWNPSFDERTGITLGLKLVDDQPLVTTEKDVDVIKQTGENTLSLVPERQFLEWITSYTGPLEQFHSSENLALYFTLTGKRAERKYLYLTAFDINKRNAVTLHWDSERLEYIDAVVSYNKIASEMEAMLQSAIGKEHPWRRNHAILFDTLSHYYFSIINALNRSHLQSTTLDNSIRKTCFYLMRLYTLKFT